MPAKSPLADAAHHGHGLPHGSMAWPLRIGLFLAVWVVMLGAMMLPTLVPLARRMNLYAAESALDVQATLADEQLQVYRETNDLKAVVDRLIGRTMENVPRDIDLGAPMTAVEGARSK